MPIKYVQTLGAVAGIPQTVNSVVITCSKPAPLTIRAIKPVPLTITASKPTPLVITMKPTLKPSYGGD